jgi:hypothetical protein
MRVTDDDERRTHPFSPDTTRSRAALGHNGSPVGSWVVNGWYTGAKGVVLNSLQVRKLVDKMYSSNRSKSPVVRLAQHHDALGELPAGQSILDVSKR